jgi:hypothetical protein
VISPYHIEGTLGRVDGLGALQFFGQVLAWMDSGQGHDVFPLLVIACIMRYVKHNVTERREGRGYVR